MSLRVGLVGAGPWARMATGPMLAAGPATTLAGVWARRPEAAAELGAGLGVPVASSFEALLSTCDAVAFAVPPDVQARLAPVAAAAGRHLMLEKPLAFTVEEAERIAAAVDEAGVVTQLMLTNRWTDAVRTFLADVSGAVPRVLTAEFVGSQASAGSPFATPWRRPEMALFDVGPHALDLVEAAGGPATVVHARRTGAATALTLEHESGAVSHVTLSIATPGARGPLRCEAVTDAGRVVLADPGAEDRGSLGSRITTDFAEAVAGTASDAPDVHRGVRLQRLLTAAERELGEPTR
ncbi:Gfo/Idh/MocA family protein [Blastococcus tunisiensis]|uniref:Predicted dehydrogenase n=1 Tax=Blastococcus tunisiensis TaxID=1798228 RepID=A0A1I2M7I0_9ACTN|nr:Gfo/Idh/MocA family oxidoreductase [Blastococcus sp. DSM 46838]SFF87463.1 Predicted dehydrogenase [Blastococcus sp. DSM 46838]